MLVVESPACSTSSPPCPKRLLPTCINTAPDFAPIESPVDIVKLPDVPTFEVPVDNSMFPVPTSSPPSTLESPAVTIFTSPDFPADEIPL